MMTDEQENIPESDALNNQAAPSAVGTSACMIELASAETVEAFAQNYPQPYWVFGEDRRKPIRRRNGMPAAWLTDPQQQLMRFEGTAQPGEFYVFQLGVCVGEKPLKSIRVEFSSLSGGAAPEAAAAIPAAVFRCFNLGGTDFMGRPFVKTVDIEAGRVQALWIGVDVPEEARGVYTGALAVKPENAEPITVELTLTVSGEVLKDHGDADVWRLSRLRWLDATIGLDDDVVVKPYEPLSREGTTLSLLGKKLRIGPNGLPEAFTSYFNAGNTAIGDKGKPFLARPFVFVVETDESVLRLESGELTFIREQNGAVEWRAQACAGGVSITCDGLMEFDGFVQCVCNIKSDTDIAVKDIRLETAVIDDGHLYFTGLGREGCRLPDTIDWKWDPLYRQDCFWIGNVNAGIRLELRGANYRPPLSNCYFRFHRLNMPDSWCNNGRGGIGIVREKGQARISVYGGQRELKAGRPLVFQVNLNLTPFHCLETDNHWATRYYHLSHGTQNAETVPYTDIEGVKGLGANVINIHHSYNENPVINYPYWEQSLPALKELVSDAHDGGVRAKVYYTARELTNHLPELWALHSLQGEIIFPGAGKDAKPGTNPDGPHPQLVEQLGEDFIPAWRQVLKGDFEGMLDLSVITTPDSRLDNFYLEGLRFLLEKAGIDGLYIDDSSLNRKSFQRARRLLENACPHPLMDLHSWRGAWSKACGWNSPILNFLPCLPYFDSIWQGEGYDYDVAPENWLVEISGIPFGLMGEMLKGGGNPWRGMVFGMTSRLGWGHGDPRPIWKVWDEFEIQGSEMLGWWDPRCPVDTGTPDVVATVYRKEGKSLVSLGSWSDADECIRLTVDWEALGLSPARVTITQPAVVGFQDEATYGITDAIGIPVSKGVILLLEE